jgi:Sensors of blue-light using FAD
LIYKGDNFIQVLEGPKECVCETYQNIILKDKRHTRCLIIYEGEIKQREFGDWGMATFNAGSYEKVIIDPVDELDEVFREKIKIEGVSFVRRLLHTYLRSF